MDTTGYAAEAQIDSRRREMSAPGHLRLVAVDRQADIAVLDIHEGDWVVYDVLGRVCR